jgi:acetyltransferase-like isoleucine patch superfamily enzyme
LFAGRIEFAICAHKPLAPCVFRHRVSRGIIVGARAFALCMSDTEVYVGAWSAGMTQIGERSHIASGVQILTGRNRYPRDAGNGTARSEHSSSNTVTPGGDCRIGGGSTVIVDIGGGTTVRAGSVLASIVASIRTDSGAAGNPARALSENRRRPA